MQLTQTVRPIIGGKYEIICGLSDSTNADEPRKRDLRYYPKLQKSGTESQNKQGHTVACCQRHSRNIVIALSQLCWRFAATCYSLPIAAKSLHCVCWTWLLHAFDIVDHDLLMLRIERQFGFRGVILQWFDHIFQTGSVRNREVLLGGSLIISRGEPKF